MWFQSWDIPSAALAVLIPGSFSEIALYNALVFLSFPMSGWTFSLLCRELWGGRLGPFLAGCLYTFSAYHFAHAQMQLHLASMQWTPIYFLGLLRMARRGPYAGSLLAAFGLTLATMASIYYAVFCAVGTLVLVVSGALGNSQTLLSKRVMGSAVVSVAVFAATTGWLLVGMAHAYLAEPYVKVHDPAVFSADLQSFFLPNAVSHWSDASSAWMRWTGNDWESSSYIGYAMFGLALAAGVHGRNVRGFLWLALVGAVLALGPHPHVGGVVYRDISLPQAWLESLVPPLGFSGLPVRFSWLTTFGIAAAAGDSLSRLCRRGGAGRAVAILLTVVALAEAWPKQFMTTSWPSPKIFQNWAQDSGTWAVLDGTVLGRAMWHQMSHRHPIIAGYATRFPERVLRATHSHQVPRAFLPRPFGDDRNIEVSAEEGQVELRRLGVRFVVVEENRERNALSLELTETYRGDGLVVYEVPPSAIPSVQPRRRPDS
jgi:hypothetical protein